MKSAISDKVTYLLRLADSNLVLGQRLAEWVGHAPALEEELALANLSLDCIGQARLLLDYAGELEGTGRNADSLAFLREAGEFRNLNLTEQENGDFAVTIVRQLLFDGWWLVTLETLVNSADQRLAAIAAKALIEVRYHWRYSRGWLVRLGDGTAESHSRVETALRHLWKFTTELFEADELDQAMVAAGVGPDPRALRDAWLALIEDALQDARVDRPQVSEYRRFGKRGEHTGTLAPLLAEMQELPRSYPGVNW